MSACLHAVALAVSFQRLGGELLNRLTALNRRELDPLAQRRRDTDAEHHVDVCRASVTPAPMPDRAGRGRANGAGVPVPPVSGMPVTPAPSPGG
jgi:hypothetical protein